MDSVEQEMTNQMAPNGTDRTTTFMNDSISSYARSALPFVSGAHRVVQGATIREDVDDGGSALQSQSVALLIFYSKGFQTSSLSILTMASPVTRYQTLVSCYGLADKQLSEIREMLRSSQMQMDIADYDSEIKRPKIAEEFDAHTFVETITSRWLLDEASAIQLGASCPRSVELHLEGAVDADAYEPLKRFDRAGMRVVVVWKGLNGLVKLV
ncbi:hypothetical protein EV368DRAFT_87939 [Lentinula lateritia]|nr:hypothetical protein EV368DRAFT_87939 [Lentinula lateritia]